MDLLRLVLARQSVDSLSRLPKLLKSRRFSLARSLALGYTNSQELVSVTTRFGEISRDSTKYLNLKYVAARAIFLRDWQHYVKLTLTASRLDFWLAMESGVPEIQAKALAVVLGEKKGHESKLTRYQYNDLTSIPWTKQLKAIIENEVVHPRSGDEITTSKLGGMLGLTVEPRHTSFDYYVGYCQKVLDGGETLEEIRELNSLYVTVSDPLSRAMDHVTGGRVARGDLDWQTAMSRHVMLSGYITPFRDILSANEGRAVEVEAYAVYYASYLALKLIVKTANYLSSIANPQVHRLLTTRRFRGRVARILGDTKLVAKLPPRILGWYHMIAFGGETTDNRLAIALGLPPIPSGTVDLIGYPKCTSLQGISYWDPANLYHHPAAASAGFDFASVVSVDVDGYRKGQVRDLPSDDEDAARTSDDPGPLYRRILAYLLGETETWRP